MSTLLERAQAITNETAVRSITPEQVGELFEDIIGVMSIRVKDYGAVGDGVTDDTEAIQAAINATSDNNKILYFEDGDYRCTDSLLYKSNTHIKMSKNAWLFPEEVGEHFINTSSISTYFDNVVFDGVNINAENITDHDSYSSAMIRPYKINGLKIINCKIINSPVSAIGGMMYIDDFLIENNYFKDTGTTEYVISVETGSPIVSANIKNGIITKNRIYNSWGVCIYIGISEAYYVENIIISENIIVGSHDNGIRIDPYSNDNSSVWLNDPSYYSNIVICNNTIVDVDGSGIRVLGKNIAVTGNTISTKDLVESDADTSHVPHGIHVGNGENISVVGNTIYDRNRVMEGGIKIASAQGRPIKNILISENTITGVREGIKPFGVKYEYETGLYNIGTLENIIISDNIISNLLPNVPQSGQSTETTTVFGIRVNGLEESYCKSIHISNNIISDCEYTGIYIRYSEVVEIHNNHVKNCSQNDDSSSQYGISIWESDEVSIYKNKVYDDQSTKTTVAAIRLNAVTDNCKIDNNDLRECLTNAISMASTLTSFTNLRIINNDMAGYETPINSGALDISAVVIKNNNGFTTESSGTATIGSADDPPSSTIDHLLDITPTPGQIRITPTSDIGDAKHWWVSDVGATSFKINLDEVSGSAVTFEWRVVI